MPTPLQRLEHDILTMHTSLSLRPTLEAAQEIGERLLEAKRLVPHGAWKAWCGRLGISYRTCAVYMQVTKVQNLCTDEISINQFLRTLRIAKRAANRTMQAETRQDAIARAGPADERYAIERADCTTYRWPREIDCICTDPPWDRLECFRWTAKFAAKHLRDGGLLIAQASTKHLPAVLGCFGDTLTYLWTFTLVYRFTAPGLPFGAAWRPVVLFTKGKWRGGTAVTDMMLVASAPKAFDDWEQPVPPFVRWLGHLTKANDLIADPFAGTGTIGVACKLVGARHYIGTEVEKSKALIARTRIADTVEGGHAATGKPLLGGR